MQKIEQLAKAAKELAPYLASLRAEDKNRALLAIAQELKSQKAHILAINAKEVAEAIASGLNEALVDRLSLTGPRFDDLIKGVEQVIRLPDPIGEILEERMVQSGLLLMKKRVPIGVLGVIYESRPNVTVDVSALAFKAGNCAILRGGHETLQTNSALMEAIQKGLTNADVPQEALQLITSPDRALVKQLLHLDTYIDMIIPRGGQSLNLFCRQESLIPVIVGGAGICHLFVDASANLEKSVDLIVNAKTDRPSVCNALDTLLVDASIAETFVPLVVETLQKKDVVFRLDPKAWELLFAERDQFPNAFQLADDSDWDTEWMSLVLGIKIVDSIDEAINHIRTYGTKHTDGILTENKENAQTFIHGVDSASVYINASTRFTDGGQYGLGAEVAISTQKLHARGPMGLKELTTYQWIMKGDYHVRTS